MTNLTPLKSDYIRALEECIKDCQRLIDAQKNEFGMEKCVELCQLCKAACAECLAACESARLDRGKMMHDCVEACEACAVECEKHNNIDCQKCASSCMTCIEELKHVMA